MGESKYERGLAIDEALERAEKLEQLEEDSDMAEEADRAEAAMKKGRERKPDQPKP